MRTKPPGQKPTTSVRKRTPKDATQTQTERAYAAIKRAILQGEIEEGVFLSETEVMARYAIGRTPYREACNRLHHEGLLQVVPRRGYFVPEISFHAVCDLFEVRVILEDAIAQLAALRATDQEIDELQRITERPLPAGKSPGEFTQLILTNTEFHLCLAKATRNRRLIELLRQNLESTERLMYIELRSRRFRAMDFRALHSPIIEALRSRDPLRVRQAVWDDILEAQGATMAFKSAMPERMPAAARLALGLAAQPAPSGPEEQSASGSDSGSSPVKPNNEVTETGVVEPRKNMTERAGVFSSR